MKSTEIRTAFLRFFESKQHKIVSSAPLVVKNDPTLMFTNAGMNQFKDIFLGNSATEHKRIANSQKCLRVSGKHNDLEEVGHDTYHHTMFEMLGNWSFGDYFKEESIDWAWEFLTEILKINKEDLYVTVFEGSKEEGLDLDSESIELWKKHVPIDRIIYGNKKDNFWEMGEQGPCGPCSEIHIDLRSQAEKDKLRGKDLVNASHPQVIEIWNLVFIQFNRKADRSLELLPDKHVDTGMGFERLVRVVQGKTSNYDTDIFMPVIFALERISAKKYGENEKVDIAMRVIADHLRAVSFAIADGQIPSNNKAGYVIRRILRRAVRYGYSFLDLNEAFMFSLLPALIDSLGQAYPELEKQKEFIQKVISEEETTFLRTLSNGMRMLEQFAVEAKANGQNIIKGTNAFVLYDTFGFPLDLTELLAREQSLIVDLDEFKVEMEKQKERSRSAATQETGDWIVLKDMKDAMFTGYDQLVDEVNITKYRKISVKGQELYHIVLDKTPFYGESGGQKGDKGLLKNINETIEIIDTLKENNLVVHIANELPLNLTATFTAQVDKDSRESTMSNHSATHMLHLALRSILGTHVEQKGSLVGSDRLRFDFSHFQRMTAEEIQQVEKKVNNLIQAGIVLQEHRSMPVKKAQEMGAMALFGEKYGEEVRVIRFGDSIELCGGTHVENTQKIGLFVILSESAVAAGIRRIEAITGMQAFNYLKQNVDIVQQLKEMLKSNDPITSVQNLAKESSDLKKQIERLEKASLTILKDQLLTKIQTVNGKKIIAEKLNLKPDSIKDLCFQLKSEFDNLVVIIGIEYEGKAYIAVAVSDDLVKSLNINASAIIKQVSPLIEGGGGGQAFYASAGGKNIAGIVSAIESAVKLVS